MKSKLGPQKRRPISISQNKLLELQNNRNVEAIIIIIITTILNKKYNTLTKDKGLPGGTSWLGSPVPEPALEE